MRAPGVGELNLMSQRERLVGGEKSTLRLVDPANVAFTSYKCQFFLTLLRLCAFSPPLYDTNQLI